MDARNHESFDYSSRIISLNDAVYEPTENEQPITIDIVGDKMLEYDEKRIIIQPDTLALNGLLLLRHKGWVKPGEIRDAVGFRLTSTSFTHRFRRLSAAIEQITDFPNAVEQQGVNQNTVVRLSPLLELKDVRDSSDGYGIVSEQYDEQGIPRTVFATSEQRRKALSDLFQKNAKSSQAALHMASVQLEHAQKSPHEIKLSPHNVYDLLVDIELGLHAYLHHDEDEEEAGLGATTAYYSLLASLKPILTKQASKWWRYKEELVQEGSVYMSEKIMDLSGSEDLHQVAEDFYPTCATIVNSRYIEFMRREGATNRAINTYAFQIEFLVRKAEKRLTEEHGRQPSASEIHAELNDPAISLTQVKNTTRRMQSANKLSLSHFDLDNFGRLPQSHAPSGTVDDQIERIYREDVTKEVFSSDDITDKEKIVLSLFHGIYVRRLAGAELYKRQYDTKKSILVFTYPHDLATFEAITQDAVGNLSAMGRILNYDHKNVSKILNGAHAKAYAELKELVDDASF